LPTSELRSAIPAIREYIFDTSAPVQDQELSARAPSRAQVQMEANVPRRRRVRGASIYLHLYATHSMNCDRLANLPRGGRSARDKQTHVTQFSSPHCVSLSYLEDCRSIVFTKPRCLILVVLPVRTREFQKVRPSTSKCRTRRLASPSDEVATPLCSLKHALLARRYDCPSRQNENSAHVCFTTSKRRSRKAHNPFRQCFLLIQTMLLPPFRC
jgi:hypothetical protein